MRHKRKLLIMLFAFITMVIFPIEADAATPAQVKSVKVKEVKKSYIGWWGEGNKKTRVFYACKELSWKRVKGASGYVIYRYGNASKTWHKIKTIKKVSTTKYIIPELIKGYRVKIRVAAFQETSTGRVYGKESKAVSFTPKKNYELEGVIKTKKYNPVESTRYYRFMSEDAFVIQNGYRTKKGIKPLKWDESLYEMGKIRGKEIYNKFSHTRPNGAFSTTVLDDYYKREVSCDIPSLLMKFRENIAFGYVYPYEVMKGWKNSIGHYHSLLMKNLRYGAIACYRKNEESYWVSMFSEPQIDELVNSIE